MKESIEIYNIGPLKNVRIDDIRPLTVLIGPSGSGKSLFMKILCMMRYIYKRLNIRAYLHNAGIRRTPFRMRVDSLLHDDLKVYLTKSGTRVRYSVTFESTAGSVPATYFVELSGGKLSISKTFANAHISFTKEVWVAESRNVIASWNVNPANARAWLGFYFHETLSDFNEAIALTTNLDLSYVNAKLSVHNAAGRRRVMFAVDGKHAPMELRYASSGMQTAAPLSVLTNYFSRRFSFKEAKRRSVLSYLFDDDSISKFHPEIELSDLYSVVNLHIEEPELSLDPHAQIRLMESVVRTAFNAPEGSNEVNLFVATHSPYIVNALNLFISRKDGDGARIAPANVGVYRLADGTLFNLMATDENGIPIVDTADLTEPMEQIMEEYIRTIS